MSTTVGLVDDHRLFRQALRALLDREPEVSVVGEASDSHSAFELVEQHRPDVLVLDVRLPGASGLSVARELRARCPELRVIYVSGADDHATIAEAWRQGASGFVSKGECGASFLEAVRTVVGGGRWWPDVDFTNPALAATSPEDPLSSLSPREREVFRLVVRGVSNEGAGTALGISARTVETHRANMMRKLGCSTVSELFRFAARHALLED
jgi:two-component system NarL family response regulator